MIDGVGCVRAGVADVQQISVVVGDTAKRGSPKFLTECTRSLTGQNVVDMIVTNLAVFQRPNHDSPFRLVELAPGVTADEIAAKTTAKYEVAL